MEFGDAAGFGFGFGLSLRKHAPELTLYWNVKEAAVADAL
jgi:hypothetical protein